MTLAKVVNADRSDGVELQQRCGRSAGLFLYLANSCLVRRFMIVATAGDSLPDAIVGASEDGVFEVNGLSPIREHENLKWCASHIRHVTSRAGAADASALAFHGNAPPRKDRSIRVGPAVHAPLT
jgi:hypothetical protein